MICPNCHSRNFEDISGQYETGVVAPDGYRESIYERGFQCQQCGTVFDETEADNENSL